LKLRFGGKRQPKPRRQTPRGGFENRQPQDCVNSDSLSLRHFRTSGEPIRRSSTLSRSHTRKTMSRHAAETTFAGLLTYLKSFPPSPRHSTLHARKRSLETIPYPRVPFKKNPHKKPHPKYKDGVTILGKTKFGIPVTEEQFVRSLSFSRKYLAWLTSNFLEEQSLRPLARPRSRRSPPYRSHALVGNISPYRKPTHVGTRSSRPNTERSFAHDRS
jgi:hypothetical protein